MNDERKYLFGNIHTQICYDGTCIVLQLLSKQKRDQQEAVWELLHTEVSYMKKVKVIIDVSHGLYVRNFVVDT